MSLGGRAALQLAVTALEVVEADEVCEVAAGLRAAVPLPQPAAFMFQAPDEALDEDVVLPTAAAGHALLDAAAAQIGPEAARRELRTLVAVEDGGTAIVAAGISQRIQAQIGVSRVRQAEADAQARVQVNDDGCMHQARADLELGQVAGPHLVGRARLLMLQQVGRRRGAKPRPGAAVRTGRGRTQLGIDHQAPRHLAFATEPQTLKLQGQPPGAHARLLAVQGHCCRQHPPVFRRRAARPVVGGVARQAYTGALAQHRPLVGWIDHPFAFGRSNCPNACAKKSSSSSCSASLLLSCSFSACTSTGAAGSR